MRNNKYKTFNHAKTKIRYHIIFSTKYRRKLIEPIKDDLFKYMYLAEEANKNFTIELMETDKDHIHFLLEIKPCESIANVIKILKQFSTYNVWKNHYSYMSDWYYKQHHLWTRGYFVATIGECSEQTIRHYIENQG